MTSPRRPPGRYDEPRRLATPLRYLLVGAGILALVGFSYAAFRHAGRPAPKVDLVGYQVVDSDTVSLTFQVQEAITRTTTCVTLAYDADHATVGSSVLILHAGTQGAGRVTRSMHTSRRAATAVLDSCSP